ncbi:hypothetical protein [Helicobacter sp. MIT 05-5294]|uniref:hypothetical protein n=1 Tax=Helicobacter sp. MIT 05-5294 TaxID=1548150 RepID=UPI0010FDCCAC|nr:hypothetical protein [Helicobacter sp. MIT 05-5294]TLD87220.1 hypothetical protein LS69_004160 [Helicobacter sp. MIT 05-5294]
MRYFTIFVLNVESKEMEFDNVSNQRIYHCALAGFHIVFCATDSVIASLRGAKQSIILNLVIKDSIIKSS